MKRRAALAACVFILIGPAQALELAQCDRVTHTSHGGEDMHRDLGEGRVMWREWWSQEGTSSDFWIMDCGSGQALKFRTAEVNMGDPVPFERTEDALKVVDRHESGARIFATLARIANDLEGVARDVAVQSLTAETCACAALYAEMQGEKAGFALKN